MLIDDSVGDNRIFRSEMIVALTRMREQMRIKENQDHYIFPVSILILGLIYGIRYLLTRPGLRLYLLWPTSTYRSSPFQWHTPCSSPNQVDGF